MNLIFHLICTFVIEFDFLQTVGLQQLCLSSNCQIQSVVDHLAGLNLENPFVVDGAKARETFRTPDGLNPLMGTYLFDQSEQNQEHAIQLDRFWSKTHCEMAVGVSTSVRPRLYLPIVQI